jgi:Asp/Glu/hydantoin racemase
MKVPGGRPYYGEAIGIALFDGRRYPMVPGDVGNASSYGFPVRLKVVKGLLRTPAPPVISADGNLSTEARLLVEAGRELEAEGVHAVVTACGFFSLLQDVLAKAVAIPVFTSPLMLIPLIRRMTRPDRQIGVITASKELLTWDYLEAVGVERSMSLVITGLETSSEFTATHMGGSRIEMDVDLLRREVVEIATDFQRAHPALGAIVLECTTLPTFAADIQRATALPVYDYIGFCDFIYRSVVQRPYDGFL